MKTIGYYQNQLHVQNGLSQGFNVGCNLWIHA